jgi:alpha-amylase
LADVVGINEINAAAIKSEGVYTINGMKVNVDARLPKGIYIIDGKKVVIK